MNENWHDDWQNTPPAAQKPRKPPGMAALFGAILVLTLIMAAAIHWRDLIGAMVRPAPPQIQLIASPADRESGRFSLCHGPRITCVVDGDTIWYNHEKIRITDINAPEISEPSCDYELDLGEKAADRLVQLLNQGRFSLVAQPKRDTDKYGRKLRSITRGGTSLGEVLVAEGLAERWVGYRRNWCK